MQTAYIVLEIAGVAVLGAILYVLVYRTKKQQ
ncbi:MAG: hypothetical protein JWQ79_3941 [Mucilaginibacter sp.]|jgi:hypothetical protein|nr:hypothetical protein [Mucilaginibacter sp.]